jgi:hypothetical protein
VAGAGTGPAFGAALQPAIAQPRFVPQQSEWWTE